MLYEILKWAWLTMSVVGFAVTAWDKRLAIKHKWRIPERTLFIIAALLGAPGVLLAMLACRHKIRKWYFIVFIPLFTAAQAALVIWLGVH